MIILLHILLVFITGGLWLLALIGWALYKYIQSQPSTEQYKRTGQAKTPRKHAEPGFQLWSVQ